MIRKLTSRDYTRSAWSGGTTTQLAIFPPGARYADRDFLWRVSSAAVELEASDFTPLPDYERLIATLEGEIVLTHNGGAPIRLRPFEVHAFSGADATHSRGRCTDFNLMLRRGRAEGTMELLRLERAPAAVSCGAGETLLLYCVFGQCTAETVLPRDACERPLRPGAEGPEAAPCAQPSPICHPERPKGLASRRSEAESKDPFSLAPGEALRVRHPERSESGAEGSVSLASGETLLLTGPALLTLSGVATLMLCRIRLC